MVGHGVTEEDRPRILVKATNWLGDVVMGNPALRALRAAAPDAHLAVLIRSELASLLAGMQWIDEVIAYRHPVGTARLRQLPRIVRTIRAGRFDWAIVFPNHPEDCSTKPERVAARAQPPRSQQMRVIADSAAESLTGASRTRTHDLLGAMRGGRSGQ
jgi:hypothetical protein